MKKQLKINLLFAAITLMLAVIAGLENEGLLSIIAGTLGLVQVLAAFALYNFDNL